MEWVNVFWQHLTSQQPQPYLWMILCCWGVSIVLVFTPLWKITRNAITVVHEAGHAFIALLFGRRISGIKLHSDTSGVTITKGNPKGFGMIFVTIAGYVSPAFLGLGVQYLSSQGKATLGLFILVVMLFFVLVSIRNFWGIVVVLPLTLGFYYALQFTPEIQVFILLFIAVFLTSASLKPIIELQKQRRTGQAKDSDADQLFTLTLIPGIVWVVFFFVVSLATNCVTVYWQIQPYFF